MDEKQIRENFASNLSRLRKYNKMSQQELANKLSYSDKAISKWELGDNIPDVMTLHRIAELFNVTVDDLIKPNVSVSKSLMTLKNRIMITAISAGGGILLGFIGLLVLSIIKDKAGISSDVFQKFIFCCYPLSILFASIVLIVFTCIWFENIWKFLSVSTCIWSASFVGMIWLEFSYLWIVILISTIINVLFGVFLLIKK